MVTENLVLLLVS